MDDAVPAALVQVGQASGDSQCNLVPSAPVQQGATTLEEMDVERTVWHVFVDEKPAVAIAAEADELNQVDVLDDPNRTHFSSELLVSLEAAVESLHRDTGGVTQLALEDRAEATLS